MRNPWGKESYNGPWGDKDTENWTPKIKEELNFVDANDGVFYMPFSVFRQAMDRYSIAMYKESLKRHTKKGDGKPGKIRKFFFKNPSRQEVVLTFDKMPPRMIPRECSNPPSNYNIYIKQDGKLLKHEPVAVNTQYQAVHLGHLKEGKYKIIIIDWEEKGALHDYVLTSYAHTGFPILTAEEFDAKYTVAGAAT